MLLWKQLNKRISRLEVPFKETHHSIYMMLTSPLEYQTSGHPRQAWTQSCGDHWFQLGTTLTVRMNLFLLIPHLTPSLHFYSVLCGNNKIAYPFFFTFRKQFKKKELCAFFKAATVLNAENERMQKRGSPTNHTVPCCGMAEEQAQTKAGTVGEYALA